MQNPPSITARMIKAEIAAKNAEKQAIKQQKIALDAHESGIDAQLIELDAILDAQEHADSGLDLRAWLMHKNIKKQHDSSQQNQAG